VPFAGTFIFWHGICMMKGRAGIDFDFKEEI